MTSQAGCLDVEVIERGAAPSPRSLYDHVNQSNYLSKFLLASLKMVESKPNEFFPKIGQVVEKTDALEDKDISEQTKRDDDKDHPVEEVESLCMNCGEQVSDRVVLGMGFAQRFGWLYAGRHEAAANDYPVLQGGDHYVVQV